jgi:transposase
MTDSQGSGYRLKDFRAVATRYDKRGRNYLAGVLLTSIIIWL